MASRVTGAGQHLHQVLGGSRPWPAPPGPGSTASAVVDQPLGDGAMTTALPPLTAIMALLIGVAAGFVDGVMAATTPTGLA